MIPIRDSIRARRFPVVTVGIIAANSAVFGYQLLLGAHLEPFVMQWSVVPARLLGGLAGNGDLLHEAATVFSSMFMHGGFMHFLGNMWFLWIFGDNVEDRFGRLGFPIFYAFAGVVAAMSQVLVAPSSDMPMLGASGAIAGVLGAYARFYPKSRVLTLVPIFILIEWIEIPASIFLGLWLAIQIASSCAGGAGVAWWAHIAGFAVGLLLSFLAPARREVSYRPKPQRRRIRW